MATTLHKTRARDLALLESLEASGSRTFSLAKAREVRPEVGQADIRRMRRAGWIGKVSRSLYTVTSRPHPASEARLRLATAAYAGEPHYISWAAALSFHGMTEKDPLRVAVAVRKRHRERQVGPMRVEPVLIVPAKFYGYREVRDRDAVVHIATPEKAIIDSVDRPRLAGGLSEAVKALGAAGTYDPTKLVRLARRHPSEATVSRLGYLMTALGIPGADELSGLVGRRRRVLPLDVETKSTKGVEVDPVWRIADTVGRELLRQWAEL